MTTSDRATAGPLSRIASYSMGDLVAKTLHFFSFIYLARILGVHSYGVLEFALATSTYVLFLADSGLELWAIREGTKAGNIRELAGKVLPLRGLLSGISFMVLVAVLPLFPELEKFRALLLLFGSSVFLQAFNLKWSFLARQRMTAAAGGLVLTQALFAAGIFLFVKSPQHVLFVPIARLAADLITVLFFAYRFIRENGWPASFSLKGAGAILRPAAIMGLSSALALMSYNFDSVLLGFLIGPGAVGLYSAAYKPVTVALAMPLTFFIGLYPVLSHEFVTDRSQFSAVMVRSFEWAAFAAFPIGIGAMVFANPLIAFLFGPEYAESAYVLQVLIWSGVAVILRGTFKQGLVSANYHELDLLCAAIATSLNIVLNLLLIRRYGVIGAAAATVVAESIWLVLAYRFFTTRVIRVPIKPVLLKPLIATAAMSIFLYLSGSLFWMVRAVIAAAIYAGVYALLRIRTRTV